jgi:hypothetical protein
MKSNKWSRIRQRSGSQLDPTDNIVEIKKTEAGCFSSTFYVFWNARCTLKNTFMIRWVITLCGGKIRMLQRRTNTACGGISASPQPAGPKPAVIQNKTGIRRIICLSPFVFCGTPGRIQILQRADFADAQPAAYGFEEQESENPKML